MTCPKSQWAVFRELPNAEQAALLRHAAECAACATARSAYEAQDQALTALPSIRPSEDMIRATLARTTQRPARQGFSRPWRTAIVTITALVVFAMAGTYGVAAQALPGDALYGLKRAGEQVRLALTLGTEARAQYQEALEAMRRAEVAEALRTGRDVEVGFGGRVELATEEGLVVEGLPVRLEARLAEAPAIGAWVRVRARTEAGALVALDVQAEGTDAPSGVLERDRDRLSDQGQDRVQGREPDGVLSQEQERLQNQERVQDPTQEPAQNRDGEQQHDRGRLGVQAGRTATPRPTGTRPAASATPAQVRNEGDVRTATPLQQRTACTPTGTPQQYQEPQGTPVQSGVGPQPTAARTAEPTHQLTAQPAHTPQQSGPGEGGLSEGSQSDGMSAH
ncbi:MAG: DUF5667 domain-containing protein [Anaerolineae bacterium]